MLRHPPKIMAPKGTTSSHPTDPPSGIRSWIRGPLLFMSGELSGANATQVVAALRATSWQTGAVRWRTDGASFLHAETELIQLKVDCSRTERLVLTGSIGGTLEVARWILRDFSKALEELGIVHHISAFHEPEEHNLIAEYPAAFAETG